jgi:hypothetical protein
MKPVGRVHADVLGGIVQQQGPYPEDVINMYRGGGGLRGKERWFGRR